MLPAGYKLVGPGKVILARRRLIIAIHAWNNTEGSGCYHHSRALGNPIKERIIKCEIEADAILKFLKEQASSSRRPASQTFGGGVLGLPAGEGAVVEHLPRAAD